MSYFSPVRDRSPEHTPMGSPESPAANADTRATITWLMQVQYHAGIASAESKSTLLALARALPVGTGNLDPGLASVITSIQSFANTAIYDPFLADKATIAIDSLTANLSSPVKVVSPSKKANALPLPVISKAVRKLNFEEFE